MGIIKIHGSSLVFLTSRINPIVLRDQNIKLLFLQERDKYHVQNFV
jgi:hypothetical protein